MSAPTWQVLQGDVRERLRGLPAESVQCVVTSPPYWGLRDYGMPGQLGAEPAWPEYVAAMVDVFREVRRVLKVDGTLWLNLGDCYAGGATVGAPRVGIVPGGGGKLQGRNRNGVGAVDGLKPKDLVGIPWRVAFALQADGWTLRSDIVWAKPNPMPESVRDRPTKAHEYVFLLSKGPRYFYDANAVREPATMKPQRRTARARYEAPGAGEHRKGTECLRDEAGMDSPDGQRNRRTVWTVAPKPFKGAHFAVMPPALVEPCVKAGSRPGDVVLDPFAGSGTTGVVALGLGRSFLGLELNPEYCRLAEARLAGVAPLLASRAEEAA